MTYLDYKNGPDGLLTKIPVGIENARSQNPQRRFASQQDQKLVRRRLHFELGDHSGKFGSVRPSDQLGSTSQRKFPTCTRSALL